MLNLSATEMVRRVRAKEISPVELMQAHLERIEKLNGKLNVFVALNPDALDEARALEGALARGATCPLCGVPMSMNAL